MHSEALCEQITSGDVSGSVAFRFIALTGYAFRDAQNVCAQTKVGTVLKIYGGNLLIIFVNPCQK